MRIMTAEEAKKFEENEQIQYVVSKFQSAMAQFSGFEEKLQEVSNSFFAISEKVSGLMCDQTRLSSIITSLTKDVSGNSSYAETKVGNLGSSISSLVADIVQIKTQFDGLAGVVSIFSSQITALNDKTSAFASSTHVSDLKNDIRALLEEVKARHQNHEEKFINLNSKIESRTAFAESIHQDLSDLRSLMMKNDSSIKNVYSDVALGKEYLETSLSSLQEKVLNYINDTVSSIPQPIIPSLEDAKKAFEDKLIPVSLDAKNANIRSSNNENKLLILEKRIEQLQLLINKLQNQG